MIHISLFSGIGGFELAAEEVEWKNYASCEINDFGHTILNYYWPDAYHHRDVKTLTYEILNAELTKRFGPNWRTGGVILSGGFPCQGFSVAGLRAGTDDDRYLWPEYLRLIDEINPDWVCGENVTGILTMEDKSGIYRDVFAKVENRKITRLYPVDYYEAIYTRQVKMLVGSICEDLEKRGYEVQTFALPACSVQAPHIRERIWFVAHSDSSGFQKTGAEFSSKRIKQHRELDTTTITDDPNAGTESLRREREDTIYETGPVTNPGCIAGDRGKSERPGNGIDNGENSGRTEAADQFERSYKTWDDTENQTEWRNLAGLFTRPGESFGPVADTIGDDAGRYGHGETGCETGALQEIEKERERLWAQFERTGGEGVVADTDRKFEPSPQPQKWGNKERSRRQFERSDKIITTDIQCNRGIKGFEIGQSKQFNQESKTRRTDEHTDRERCEERLFTGITTESRFSCGGYFEDWSNWPTQSPVCGGDDGISERLDAITFSKWRNESIKGLGNAVVPQVVVEIFKAIDAYERGFAA
jgi:DNA (cytosine-5)-methyltransferase 1